VRVEPLTKISQTLVLFLSLRTGAEDRRGPIQARERLREAGTKIENTTSTSSAIRTDANDPRGLGEALQRVLDLRSKRMPPPHQVRHGRTSVCSVSQHSLIIFHNCLNVAVACVCVHTAEPLSRLSLSFHVLSLLLVLQVKTSEASRFPCCHGSN
jgi:hypothetical protein